MPENRSSPAAYARTRTRTPYSPSTPSRIPKNREFSGLSHPARLGRMHIHAMHLTNTTLVGSGCTYVHKVGKVRHCNDANRAAHTPAINHKITIATILGRTGTNKLWS